MKLRKTLYGLMVCAAFASCTDFVVDSPAEKAGEIVLEVTFNETKTALLADGYSVAWQSGDQISVFSGSKGYCFTTEDSGRSARFTGTGTLSEKNYALYPYCSTTKCNSGVMTSNIPTIQRPGPGGFDPTAAISVASFDNAGGPFTMRNAVSAIKFKLTQTDVVKVTLSGLGGEKISGAVFISIDEEGIPVIDASYGKEVSLANADGSAMDPGTYYLLLAPASFQSGLKLVYHYTDESWAEKTTTKACDAGRGKVINFTGAEDGLQRQEFVVPTVGGFDFEPLAAKKHPRLFVDDDDFAAIKADVETGANPYVCGIHNQIMNLANTEMRKIRKINYKDYGGYLYFGTGIHRIIWLSYAWRYTGDKKYSDYAISCMMDLCGFPDWMPEHYLSTADIMHALAVGYDWMYDILTEEQKSLIVSRIKEYGLAHRNDSGNIWWHANPMNWNQVCNGAMILAALSIFTAGDQECTDALRDAIRWNRNVLDNIYGQDGAYNEGPNYWRYGTGFQTMTNAALLYALGTDFGMSSRENFKKTAWYKIFSTAPTGLGFNYADCDAEVGASMSLWYFAQRFDNPGLLHKEVDFALSKDAYEDDRCPLLTIWCAHKLGMFAKGEAPEELVYTAYGDTPLIMARTGWTADDQYLGLKGGRANIAHAHMDAGSFIYEADGIRWASDYDHPEYSAARKGLEPYGESLFSTDQDALRFQMLPFNNRCHNTLTINDRDHCVSGKATIVRSYDEPGCLGGTMELTPVFFKDLQSARRTALLKDGHLEITDAIVTKAGAPAKVRWTLLTEAVPEVHDDHITLVRKGKRMEIRVSGCKPEFKKWSSDPKDWPPGPTRSFEEVLDAKLCGYEYEIPAGTTSEVTTTFIQCN